MLSVPGPFKVKRRMACMIGFGLAVALMLAQGCAVAAYLGAEDTLYVWDYAMYAAMAQQAYAAAGQGWAALGAALAASMPQNYNLIFTLPSLPAFALFGATRSVFILANFAVYGVLFQIAAAGVARRALNIPWRVALPLVAALAMLVPVLWLPLLEGYPDIGAAAALTFAAGLGLPGLARPRAALAFGALLTVSVLLRRHFAYPALALAAVAALFDCGAALWTQRDQRGRAVLRVIGLYALAGAAALALMALASLDMLGTMLAVDYTALYASYKRETMNILAFLWGTTGIVTPLAALAGFVWAGRRGVMTARAAAFAPIWMTASLILWCAGPAQMGHHYLIHVAPLCLILGLAALARTAWFSGARARGAILALFILLAGGSVWSLALAPQGLQPNEGGGLRLWPAPHPPDRRDDLAALEALGRHLKVTTTPDDRIMVVGSSFILNQDVLRAVYTDRLHIPNMVARFVWAPEIDTVQDAPLDAFAAATVYLVADPPQYHLDPAGQSVVTAAARQFPPPADRAALFRQDAQSFTLKNGVQVQVWRRADWTPGALHAVLTSIRAIAPAGQRWVRLDASPAIQTQSGPDGTTLDILATTDKPLTLFYDRPLQAGNYRLAMDLGADPVCESPRFTWTLKDAAGRVVYEDSFAAVVLPGPLRHAFDIAGDTGVFGLLTVQAASHAGRICPFMVQGLSLEP